MISSQENWPSLYWHSTRMPLIGIMLTILTNVVNRSTVLQCRLEQELSNCRSYCDGTSMPSCRLDDFVICASDLHQSLPDTL